MTSTFNFNRFRQLLKWDLLTDYKDYVRCTVAMVTLFSFILFCIPVKYDTENTVLIIALGAYASMFLMTIGASFIFKNLKDTQDRIAFLIMPASNLEKYLARFIHITLGYAICLLVSFILADGIQYVLKTIFWGIEEAHSLIAGVLRLFDKINQEDIPSFSGTAGFLFTIMTIAITANATWTFCGTLFRRNAWLWTIVMQLAIILLTLPINLAIVFDLSDMDPNHAKSSYWLITGIMWVVSIACYWGSYKLFCRFQVINNKWLNI